jgi:hypothetical protein
MNCPQGSLVLPILEHLSRLLRSGRPQVLDSSLTYMYLLYSNAKLCPKPQGCRQSAFVVLQVVPSLKWSHC